MASAYYAICPGTGGTSDKKTGSPTITIASGVATLSVAQTGNIGQGFRITYDTSKVCYISKVNSSTSFDVVTATGGTPSNESTAVTVNSIAADYASLSAAEAGASDSSHLNTSDLVTATTILNLVCYAGASDDIATCTIDGYTTSADYYINIYVANGGTQSLSSNRHIGIWDSSKYILAYSGTGHAITVSDPNVYVVGLQLSHSTSTSARGGIYVDESSTTFTVRIRYCLIKCVGTAATGQFGIKFNACGASSSGIVNDTIIWGFNYSTDGHGVRVTDSDWTAQLFNCDIFSCNMGVSRSAGLVGVVNCAVFNNADDYNGTITVTYSAQDDTQTGTGNVDLADSAASWDDQFADYDATNPDMSLVGNSLLLMVGTGPDSEPNVLATDIAGNPRAGTLTSIGAFHKGLTDVYYSLSPYGTGDIKTGTPTCGISSGVMTLSAAQTGNIGIGCAITYDTSKIVYISAVNSSTSFDVVDKYGVAPPDCSSGTTVNSITHVWASMSAAEAGADDSGYLNTVDLTSANVVLNLCCYYDHDDYTADRATLVVNGYTTDSTRYIKIFTPTGGTQSINNQRHAGVYDDEKFMWNSSASNWTIQDDYIQVIGIQLLSNAAEHRLLVEADYCVIDAMINIPLSSTGSDYGIRLNGSGRNRCDVRNSIVTGADRGISRYNDGSGAILYIHNCTVYNCTVTAGIADRQGSSIVATNCVVHTCADDFNGSGMTITYCASEDNDGTNSVNLSGVAASAIWTDAANGNFSLVSGSPLYDAGTDLSAYFTTDIAGTTRSTWDIGAFEYVASGGSSPKWNGITPAKWNGIDWSNLKWNGM
jgi:hypothetical protein